MNNNGNPFETEGIIIVSTGFKEIGEERKKLEDIGLNMSGAGIHGRTSARRDEQSRIDIEMIIINGN